MCSFNLDEVSERIGELIDHFREEEKVDAEKIGLISNSISAIPSTKFLIDSMNSENRKINSYASISPILGWDYFLPGNERLKNKLVLEEGALSVKTLFDMKNGIERTLELETVKKLKETDCLKSLAECRYENRGMNVMTIIGKNDYKASPDSMRKYHEILGGKLENKIEFESGHDVPNSNSYVIDFMAKNLL